MRLFEILSASSITSQQVLQLTQSKGVNLFFLVQESKQVPPPLEKRLLDLFAYGSLDKPQLFTAVIDRISNLTLDRHVLITLPACSKEPLTEPPHRIAALFLLASLRTRHRPPAPSGSAL